jgi:hypothetical protein
MTTPGGVEPFCLLTARLVAIAEREELLTGMVQAPRQRPPEPETPPPRAA